MFTVYALYNKDHKKLYIGQTKDINERFIFHSQKIFKRSFTAKFDGEWILIYKEFCSDRISALKREKELKSFRGREFVKQYIPW